jgi:hypothetical protein
MPDVSESIALYSTPRRRAKAEPARLGAEDAILDCGGHAQYSRPVQIKRSRMKLRLQPRAVPPLLHPETLMRTDLHMFGN